MDLLSYRPRFPILENTTYLISNSLGAMPIEAEDALARYAHDWKTQGVRAWQHWWDLSGEVGDLVSPIIGAPKNSVSMQLNVSSAEAVVASCLDFSGTRNKIVYSAMNFPSVTYVWKEQERLGARVVTIPTQDDVTIDLQELLEAIDEETIAVPISHVLFRSAFIQDAQAIAEKCRKVGAYLILDTYQSAGIVPVEVAKWGVDFAVGGTLKWLCGGPGTAFLYVRPDLAPKLRPKLTGWMSDSRPFDFVVNDHELLEGSYRFMNGTSNIPGLYAAAPGLKMIGEIGVPALRENSMRQTALLMKMADERGWKTTAPREAAIRGGTIAFDFPDAYAVAQELIERKVLVDYRPKAGLRVSAHFYNTDKEIRHFFEQAEDILSSGAHLKHQGQRTLVT